MTPPLYRNKKKPATNFCTTSSYNYPLIYVIARFPLQPSTFCLLASCIVELQPVEKRTGRNQTLQKDLQVLNKETLWMFKLSYITQGSGESHSDDLYARRGINNLWCGESWFLNSALPHDRYSLLWRCLLGSSWKLQTNFNRAAVWQTR